MGNQQQIDVHFWHLLEYHIRVVQIAKMMTIDYKEAGSSETKHATSDHIILYYDEI